MSTHPRHQHAPDPTRRAFALGVGLNLGFVLIEFLYGVAAGSLALIADAGHNLSDVFALLLAWVASVMAARAPTEARTYGLRKLTVMAALVSAVLLLIAVGAIAGEAFGRLWSPGPVQAMTVVVVAAIGFVVNTATALLFLSGRRRDLNLKGAFLHMTADAAVSLGVVVAGVLILLTGAVWIDPLISLLVALVILIGTWGLLRDSFNYAIDAVPAGLALAEVRDYLTAQPGVVGIHDLHVWPLSTTESALTVHLVLHQAEVSNQRLRQLQEDLSQRFGIDHATIQVESAEQSPPCLLDQCVRN